MAKLELSGMQDVRKKLEQLGDKARPLMFKAVAAGAEIIREDAARRCKRQPINKEHLADNIIAIKPYMRKDGSIFINIGPTEGFAYAWSLEYGHLVRSKEGYYKTEAQPFMAPAHASKSKEALSLIAKMLREGLGL